MSAAQRVFFLMVLHPLKGWTRVGNAYSSRAAAASWRSFASRAWHGLPVRVSSLTLHRDTDGRLTAATVRTLDRKFNLDVETP